MKSGKCTSVVPVDNFTIFAVCTNSKVFFLFFFVLSCFVLLLKSEFLLILIFNAIFFYLQKTW